MQKKTASTLAFCIIIWRNNQFERLWLNRTLKPRRNTFDFDSNERHSSVVLQNEMLGTAMAQLEASRQETRSCCEETKATAALLEASLRNNRVTADLLEESLRDNRVTAALLEESLQETRASRAEHRAYLVQSTARFEAKKAAFDRILTAVAAEFTLVQTL
jgi:hypothetical protein